jgi:hypothetical protein
MIENRLIYDRKQTFTCVGTDAMRILRMDDLGRPLCIVGWRLLLLVASVAVSLPLLGQKVSPQNCGADSKEAQFAVRKWLASGGVPGITTPGSDSLQLLTDEKSRGVCAVLNGYRIKNHETPRTIFRLGNHYVAVFARPVPKDAAGNLQINEGDGVVLLFDQSYTTLAIGHTKVSKTSRQTKRKKSPQGASS